MQIIIATRLILLQTILFLFIVTNCYSQDTLKRKSVSYFHQGLTISYAHHEVQFLSVGGKFLFNYDKENLQGFGTGICLDVGLNARIFTLAPRIYAEYRERYFGARLNIINYMRLSDNDLRLIPEIFISYKDYISLGAGYGFNLGINNFDDVSLYRVSLTYSFLK